MKHTSQNTVITKKLHLKHTPPEKKNTTIILKYIKKQKILQQNGCENMSENIKTAVEELHKLINVDNVIGTPIETEDKILIPVIKIGVGFGAGENILGREDSGAVGAGAGVEPTSMVVIPKKGNDAEGIRVLDLSKGSETTKAISDIGLMISDLIKNYLDLQKSDTYYDESEYIEPEFSTTEPEE